MPSVLSTSRSAGLGEKLDTSLGNSGLYFRVRCEGTEPVLLTGLCIPGFDLGEGCQVVLYVCVEGNGVGREQRREAWREQGVGALKHCTVTRLPLSSPVSVAAGATVSFYLRATNGYVMYCKESAAPGTVDASDGVLSVLVGGTQSKEAGLFGECSRRMGHALAGFIEYELGTWEDVARRQGLADQALLPGTRVQVKGLGVGTYERWSKSLIGANDYFVHFPSGMKKVELKKLGPQAWAIVPDEALDPSAPEPEPAESTTTDPAPVHPQQRKDTRREAPVAQRPPVTSLVELNAIGATIGFDAEMTAVALDSLAGDIAQCAEWFRETHKTIELEQRTRQLERENLAAVRRMAGTMRGATPAAAALGVSEEGEPPQSAHASRSADIVRMSSVEQRHQRLATEQEAAIVRQETAEVEQELAETERQIAIAELQAAEMQSDDPFVQKKLAIQHKIAETKAVGQTPPNHCTPMSLIVVLAPAQHVDKRAELLNSGGKGSVETVKASAAIRKDLKELEALKAELTEIHLEEEKKAMKKARSVRFARPF